MPRIVDVLLSPDELAALGKKNTACLKLDPRTLAPAMCVSKAGASSAAMFGRLHGPGSHSNGRELSVEEYARLYAKYYGDGSLVERLVATHKAQADATRDALVDAEIKKRAVRETRAKYLTPRLAGLHGVEAAGITGPPPAPPPVLGLTMVPAHPYQQQGQQGAGQDAGSAKLLEMAHQLMQAQASREAMAEAQAQRHADEMRKQAGLTSGAVSHETSSFRTCTREHARSTGSKFVECRQSAPGPGKYEVRWSYWDKAKHTPLIVAPDYRAETRALLAKKAARAAEGRSHRNRRHSAHSVASTSGRLAGAHLKSAAHSIASTSGRLGGGGASSRHSSPGARPGSRAAHAWTENGNTGTASVQYEDSRPTTARSRHEDHQTGAGVGAESGLRRPGTAPTGGRAGPHRTAQEAALKLFKDAHHVHEQQSVAAGSSSFKATTRPALSPATAASHLACKYHHDSIDAITRKASHLVLPFQGQPPRPTPTTGSDTPAALGPGAYGTPVTFSGRHVEAGHVGIRNVPDFARTGPRPQSARDPGPQPLAEVGPQEVQRALQGLFGASLNPSDLISIQRLQAMSGVEPHYQHPGGPERPMSAMVAGSQVRATQNTRPYSARPASAPRAAAVVDHVTAATALGERPPPGQVDNGGPQHLSSEQLERYSSTGFSGRVRGGHFTRTTRAQEIQGLRVVSDGKVIPPASAPLSKIRPSQAADVIYDHVPDTVQGHHPRTPAWQLPPNRAALSQQWVSAAALAYI